MRHVCLYIGAQIFIVYVRAGPPEVVQEALADLKSWGVLPSLYLVGLSWRRSNDAALHCIAMAAGNTQRSLIEII